MIVRGKVVKNPVKVKGRFSWVVNGDDIATVAKAMNANADILEQAMIKIDQLEKEIEQLKSNLSGKENEHDGVRN